MMKDKFTSTLVCFLGLALLPAAPAFSITTNFFANFQTANGTSNATSAAMSAGTLIGSWSQTGLASGATGVGAISSNAANRAYIMAHNTTPIANMQSQAATNYFVDSGTYTSPANTYFYDASGTKVVADFASPGSFTGSGQTVVSFKWGTFGNGNPGQAKGQFVRGLDASNNEVFKLLFLSGSVSGTRIFYARGASDTNIVLANASTATLAGTTIGSGSSGTSFNSTTVNADPAEYMLVSVLLTNGQVYYTISHSQFTGTPLIANLPVNSAATTIAKLEFSMMWNNSVSNQNKGFWVDDVIVTDGPLPNPKTYRWNGNFSSAWDVNTTSNWIDTATSSASRYTEGSLGGTTAIFDDSAATPTVSLPGTVSPNVILFSNSTAAYTLSGNGKISGSGNVTVAGNGTITLATTNDFNGTVTLNAGRVRIGNDTVLGSGVVVLGNGSLSSDGATPRTVNAGITLSGNPNLGDTTDNGLLTFTAQVQAGSSLRTVTNQSDVRLAGGVLSSTGGGGITKKLGAGKLIMNGTVDMRGNLDINEGTLVLDGAFYTNNARLRVEAIGATTVARLVLTNGAIADLGAIGLNLSVGSSTSTGTNFVDLAGVYRTTTSTFASGGRIIFQNTTAPYCELNLLAGGDYAAFAVETGGGYYPTRFNFNGGTLRARADNTSFLQGLTETYVQSGGANVDSSSFNISINQDLLDGGGGFTKLGSGSLTLASSNNTYTGSTVISNGTLNLRVPFGSSSVVPAAGTTLGFVAGQDAGATKSLASLTLPGSNSLAFTFASDSAAPAGAVVTVPTITASGVVSLSVAGAWPVGTHTLLDYSGASPSFVFGSLPAGIVGVLTNDLSDTSVKLIVSFSASTKTWSGYSGSGSFGGLWDIATTPNWNADTAQYNDNGFVGDPVIFDSTVSPNLNVELPAAVRPMSVLVTNVIGGAADFAMAGPGRITGSGALTKDGGGNLTLNMTNDYTGGTVIRQGTITLNTNNVLPVAGVLTVGSPNNNANLVLNGFSQTIGGLIGAGTGNGTRRVYNGATTPATFTINTAFGVTNSYPHTLGNSTVVDGDNFSLMKSGAGEQRINLCTYTGTTTVNGGRLVYTGISAATNSIIVNSGGTLGGNGAINAPVTLNPGAVLDPADNVGAINSLTVSNSITMIGAVTNWFELNKDTLTNDAVDGITSITYSGALIASNLGTNALVGGETFQLFSAAASSGNFSSVTILPATGVTGTFNPATGVLTINAAPSIPTTSTNIVATFGGGNVSLSWPSNYLGWSLQVQTNTRSVGLGTNWVTVPGSSSVTSTNFPIGTANGVVFYRLFYAAP